MQVVDTIPSPYELVLGEIEKGILDPFDIDLEYLIELFKREAENLKEWEYLEEAGRFLEASAKLLKLKVEDIFPKPKPERKKITIKEVREALVENENSYEPDKYDLSFLWDYSPKVGRPSGAKDTKPRTLTWREFWTLAREDVPLHKEVNYHELAKEVREKIKEGKFKIRSIRDFIAYLFAYLESEDVPELELQNGEAVRGF